MIILKVLKGIVGVALIAGAVCILAFLVFQVAMVKLLEGFYSGVGKPPPDLTGTILVYAIPAALLLFLGLKIR